MAKKAPAAEPVNVPAEAAPPIDITIALEAPPLAPADPPPGPRIRNRGIIRVRVADLEDAPWNIHIHPKQQRDVFAATVDELGWYGYPDVYETAEGKTRLCDGHLRKSHLIEKYGPEAEIEVNLTDFNEAEARKANLTHDPIAALAQMDEAQVVDLIKSVDTQSAELMVMFETMLADAEADLPASESGTKSTADPLPAMELQPYEHYDYVIVLATDIHQWHALIEKLGLERVDSSITDTTTMKKIGMGRAVRATKLLELLSKP